MKRATQAAREVMPDCSCTSASCVPTAAILLAVHGHAGGTTLDACILPHMDLVVRDGCLGLLAARKRAGRLVSLKQVVSAATDGSEG